MFVWFDYIERDIIVKQINKITFTACLDAPVSCLKLD